jgi:SNF2 family DNA or RNA helicase
MLRRHVVEVAADLPPRIDIPQILSLDSEGAEDYENLRNEINAEYGEAASLVALGKLRMYCTHPFLINPNTGDPVAVSPKYARLIEILEEIFSNRQKSIIFTSYTGMADLLVSDIHSRFGVFTACIDGRTPIKERQNMVDRFSGIFGSAALVLNPRAAGTGLNVTAANHVIHYNLEWNPAIEDQASARAHRKGQALPVTVHRLYYEKTVEDVINTRILRKRDIASAAVVGHSGDEDAADIFSAIRISPLSKGNES